MCNNLFGFYLVFCFIVALFAYYTLCSKECFVFILNVNFNDTYSSVFKIILFYYEYFPNTINIKNLLLNATRKIVSSSSFK